MSPFPTKSQAEVILAHGLLPFAYIVLHDTVESLVVLRYFDGYVKHLRKQVC